MSAALLTPSRLFNAAGSAEGGGGGAAEGTKSETPNPAAGDPKPEAKPAAPATITDLGAKVKVGDKEMTIAELAAQSAKADTLRSTLTAIFSDKSTVDQRKAAVRTALQESGAEPAVIEEYIAQQFKDPAVNQDSNPNNPNKSPADKRMDDLEDQRKRDKSARLTSSLTSALDSVVDKNPNIGVLLNAAKKIGGDEQLGKAKTSIAGDLKSETIRQLRIRSQETGQEVDETWIPGAVEEAAKIVHARFGAVIGDPNRIGAVPETASGNDGQLRTDPVKAPVFDPKKRSADVEKDLESWWSDATYRDALTVGSGSSRV